MKPALFRLSAALLCVIAPAIHASQDLTIKNVQIDPQPVGSAPSSMVFDAGISYRMLAEIEKKTALRDGETFLVTAECVRGADRIILGECRIGDASGWTLYACFDFYPGQAPAGDWKFRVTVDARGEVAESDESATSNVWERDATIKAPGAPGSAKMGHPIPPPVTVIGQTVTIRLLNSTTGEPVSMGTARIFHEKEGAWKTNKPEVAGGILQLNLPAGRYRVQGKGDGFPSVEKSFEVKSTPVTVDLGLKK